MDLIARTENLLKRQADWLSSALGEYDALESELDDEAYEALLERLDAHAKAIENFREERTILEKEWQSNDAVAAPSALRTLSDEVSALTAKLQAVQNDASARTTTASARVQDELGGLQRGRNVLEGYRAGEAGGNQWIDRKG